MNFNINKIIGYFLILAGIALIIWPLYVSYNIFTGKSEPPEVFSVDSSSFEESSLDSSLDSGQLDNIENQQERVKLLLQEQLQNMLPQGAFSKLLNMISWSVLVGLFIFGGGKISFIGIKLLGTYP